MKKKIKALMHLFKAPEFWIIIFLLLYATVTRYPLLSHLSTHTYQAGADYYIFTWILSWNCHALETFDFAHYWATNAMHPYPYALAFSENLSGLLPIAFPIWLLSHNPILTINLTLQLLLCFTALSTYLVLRKLIGNGLSALTGTIIFTFCPYTLLGYTIGHPHMVALMWLPLICYANWRFWQKSGKWKHWFIIVFFWLWNFLISLYVGILMTIFFGLWNLFWFFYERPLFTVKKIIKWLFGVLLIWLLMIPVFLVYYNVTQDMGAIRTL
jgi:hypothetical protein